MTIDLDRLEALEREATWAPWHTSTPTSVFYGSTLIAGNMPSYGNRRTPGINAELIAELRNAAPELIASARELEALKAENVELTAEIDALQEQLPEDDRSDCPYYARYTLGFGEGICGYGCVDEPACITDEPLENWPTMGHPVVVAALTQRSEVTAERDALAARLERATELLRFAKPMADYQPEFDAWHLELARLLAEGEDT